MVSSPAPCCAARALLPVFTLPAVLRPLALQNPAALYRFALWAASATLCSSAKNASKPDLIITAILHTWGQELDESPSSSLPGYRQWTTAQNTWSGPKQTRWLFPVRAVAQMFRGCGLRGIAPTPPMKNSNSMVTQSPRQTAAFTELLRKLRTRRWVVFARLRGWTRPVLDYLVAIPTAWPSATDACALWTTTPGT